MLPEFKKILDDLKIKMDHSLDSFKAEMSKIRTGRATPHLLNHIMVDSYGTPTPINQVAAITVPEHHQLVVKPYEKTMVKQIIASINASKLDLQCQEEGDLVRIILPMLTEEKRKLYVIDMWKEVESFKVSIRNERRDAKKIIDKSAANEDEKHFLEEEVQKLTNQHIETIDMIGKNKEKELMTI